MKGELRLVAAAVSLLAMVTSGQAQPSPMIVAPPPAVISEKAEPALKQPAPEIEPKVQEIIRNTAGYFKGLDSFTVNITRTTALKGKDIDREVSAEVGVAMRRPNLLAFMPKGGAGATLVSNGKEVFFYMPSEKKYTANPAGPNIESLLSHSPEAAMATNFLLVQDLLRDRAETLILAGVLTGAYAGEEEITGVKYDHLKFTQKEYDWELWIASGEKPLPHKLVIDMSRPMPARPRAAAKMQGARTQVVVAFNDWTVNTELPDESFQFTPPKDAQKVMTFMEPDFGRRPSRAIGRQAPDLKLALLDGGHATISEHKGKDIVILDFWSASHNGIEQTMALVARVAQPRKGKGVVLYAVNLGDSADAIRQFLKAKNLSVPVALDPEGEAEMLYGATTLPCTVVIGKDGTIQAIHRELTPYFGRQLTAEVETLLAGKPLLTEKGSETGPMPPAWKTKGAPGSPAMDGSRGADKAAEKSAP